MNYIVNDQVIDDIQETACAIMYSSEALCDMLHDVLDLMDEPPMKHSREKLLGVADTIRIMAKHLDLKTVDALP